VARIGITLQKVKSKGSVTLQSNQPLIPPRVTLVENTVLDSEDVDAFVWGIEFVRSLAKTSPFSDILEKETSPAIYTPNELREWVINNVSGYNHYTGTCALGSVVDTSLRVKGVNNVRVADGSILLHSGNGNVHNSILTVASMASDIILGKRKV